MRVLILVLASVLSLGSAHDAKSAYAIRSAGCGTMVDPIAKQTCFNNANTSYAVESAQEMQQRAVDQQAAEWQRQRDYATSAEVQRRCERITAALLTCAVIPTDYAGTAQQGCMSRIGNYADPWYGKLLCAENATSCDAVRLCVGAPAARKDAIGDGSGAEQWH